MYTHNTHTYMIRYVQTYLCIVAHSCVRRFQCFPICSVRPWTLQSSKVWRRTAVPKQHCHGSTGHLGARGFSLSPRGWCSMVHGFPHFSQWFLVTAQILSQGTYSLLVRSEVDTTEVRKWLNEVSATGWVPPFGESRLQGSLDSTFSLHAWKFQTAEFKLLNNNWFTGKFSHVEQSLKIAFPCWLEPELKWVKGSWFANGNLPKSFVFTFPWLMKIARLE